MSVDSHLVTSSDICRTPKYKLGGLLTIDELATALRVAPRTVRDWIAQRKIPFTRVHRRIYVATGIVEQMLRRNSVAAAPPSVAPIGQGGTTNGELKT